MGEIRLIRGSKEEGGKKKRERRNREEERKDLVLFKSIPRDWFVMTLKRKEKEYYFFQIRWTYTVDTFHRARMASV